MKNTKLAIALAAAVVGIGLISFIVIIASGLGTTTAKEPSSTKSTSKQSDPQQATITMKYFAFKPASLKIPRGSTVTWVNHDDASHTVVAEDGSFSSAALKRDQTFTYTFDSSGTFSYKCDKHPSMKGTIIIE